VLLDQLQQLAFGVAVAVVGTLVLFSDFRPGLLVGEEPDEREDGVAFRFHRLRERNGGRFDRINFFFERFSFVKYANRVAIAFGHFLPVQARHRRHAVEDVRFGNGEKWGPFVAVRAVEAPGEVAGDFEVLLLVAPDGYAQARLGGGVVSEDVGRLQDRVVEQARVGRESLIDFLLVRDPFFETAGGQKREKDPRQLRDLRHVRLHEERGLVGVEAQREVVERHVQRVTAQRLGVLHGRQRMVVDDEVERFVGLLLELDVLADGAEVVAQVQLPGRLNAAGDDGLRVGARGFGRGSSRVGGGRHRRWFAIAWVVGRRSFSVCRGQQ